MKQHQRTIGKNDEWLTPPEIIEALGCWFNLDPCQAAGCPQDFATAAEGYTEDQDGLSLPWEGRVWLNPPFNRYQRPKWMEKMAEHNNGIMLIPAACETDAFYKYVWGRASGIMFLRGRPHFHYIDGTRAKANSGCTICLVSYDSDPAQQNLAAMQRSGLGVALPIPSVKIQTQTP